MDKILELSKKIQCSIHLEFNPHKDFYESAESYVSNQFTSAELEGVDLEKDIWTLQFYPHTPIGFYRLIDNDLERLFERALEINLD